MSPNDVRPGYLLSHRATLLAFGGLMLGMLLAALNQTIVATALPRIVQDLGGLNDYSWVFTAYLLASTVSVPIWGKLSDIHGRRRFFAAGIVIFMAGGIVGAAAQSMLMLVVARAIQGLGAGALIPLAIATIGDLVPPSDRGKWQGFTGAAFGMASVLGPTTGGWISDNASWRWVFLVSLPFGALAFGVVMATLKVPPHPERSRSLDYVGAALLACGLSGLLLGIIEWGSGGGLGDTDVWLPLVIAVVCLGYLARHEYRIPEPIIPVELLSDRLFSTINVAGFTVGVAMFGAIMFVPLFAQGVLGSSATSSGLVLTPLMLAMIATSVGSGQLITRTGRYKWALVSGPPVMAGGFALLASLGPDSSELHATLATVVLGLGLGLLLQNLVLVLQNSVPSRHLGAATSSAQFFRNTGGTIGVSVMGAILAAGLPPEGTKASPAVLAHAIHPIFLLGIPLMAIAFLLTLRVPEMPLRRSVREDAVVLEGGDGRGVVDHVQRPVERRQREDSLDGGAAAHHAEAPAAFGGAALSGEDAGETAGVEEPQLAQVEDDDRRAPALDRS
jgi:EmrB/QacA subfamily drug resistance transporter